MMNKKGQVGIIVAILIVALLTTVLITIQVYYIPKWMKQREAEHMDVVANQFASLKYSIDLQAMEKSNSPLINSITLGSKELPYFVTSRAFGSLQILSYNISNFSISISGEGKEAIVYSFDSNKGNLTDVLEIMSFDLSIQNLQENDTYNVSILSTNIIIKISNLFNNFLQINLTVVNDSQIIFDQPIAIGLKAGSDYIINLLNEDYKFSKDILPYLPTPYNISLNGSSNGSFVIKCLKFVNSQINQYNRIGTIKYSSQNAYFVDQDYIYEGGAVILSQSTGNTMLYPPLFNLNNQIINLTIIDIVGIAGKTGAAGYGTYSIRTNFSSLNRYTYYAKNISLKIYTLYTSAWKDFIEKEFSEKGITYSISEGIDYVAVNLQNIGFVLSIIKIAAQIGPGWVIS